MIICPSCREEIEEYSHFCDQCGQELVYCSNCGRVGMGRRCTQCGGLMAGAEEVQQKMQASRQVSVSVRASDLAVSLVNDLQQSQRKPEGHDMPVMSGIPTLTLYNPKDHILRCSSTICISRECMPSSSISQIQGGASSISIPRTVQNSTSVICCLTFRCH